MRGDRVFDTWALLAFFEGRPRAALEVDKILSSIAGTNRSIYLHTVNWTEFYAAVESAGGPQVAAETIALIDQLPVVLVGTENRDLCRRAAWYMTAAEGLTLGASFAAALADVKKAPLVTGDPRFLPLRHDMTLHWLGDPSLMAENSNT